MKKWLINLVVMAIILFSLTGCTAVSTTARSASSPNDANRHLQQNTDSRRMSEREKWKLARDSYAQAMRKQSLKDTEAAVYYYEVTLELVGSLDMASLEVPTSRVLTFQRKVLQSYDQFLASIDKLPETASSAAVLEASIPKERTPSEDLLEDKSKDRVSTPPVPIRGNLNRLPDVPEAMNSMVAGQINFFMNKGRKVMNAWMDRSTRLFPRLRPILQEEGVPEDLLFLAMIESGLNLQARSYAHAAGVWQFIPGTGKIYGLNVDRVYDERYHVEESTRAACRYLRRLYDEFGDWYLAFAGYNCGEMRVEREIKRSRTRDYWGLNRLPRQTRGYVPAFLAARAIYENPTQYGFAPVPDEVPFECERVTVTGAYRLEHIAQAAGLEPEAVCNLNPEFVRGVTPPGGQYTVRLPRKPDKAFEGRLASLPQSVVKPTRVHKVRSGETLGSIARKYGTTSAAIKAQPENRRIRAEKLRNGQQIIIPVADVDLPVSDYTAPPEKTAPVTAEEKKAAVKTEGEVASKTPEASEIVYTVHAGESLGRISRQLGVSVDEICRQNNIKDPDLVNPGRKLHIKIEGTTPESAPVKEVATAPAKETAPAAVASDTSKALTHRVQPGDTIWSIARTYGQEPGRILSWNRLTRSATIFPGQELIVNQ